MVAVVVTKAERLGTDSSVGAAGEGRHLLVDKSKETAEAVPFSLELLCLSSLWSWEDFSCVSCAELCGGGIRPVGWRWA